MQHKTRNSIARVEYRAAKHIIEKKIRQFSKFSIKETQCIQEGDSQFTEDGEILSVFE
jgi:ribosomal protein S17